MYGTKLNVVKVSKSLTTKDNVVFEVEVKRYIQNEELLNYLQMSTRNRFPYYFHVIECLPQCGLTNYRVFQKIASCLYLSKSSTNNKSRRKNKDRKKNDSEFIGFNFYNFKTGKHRPEYAKLCNNKWKYTDKAVQAIKTYVEKFPMIVSALFDAPNNLSICYDDIKSRVELMYEKKSLLGKTDNTKFDVFREFVKDIKKVTENPALMNTAQFFLDYECWSDTYVQKLENCVKKKTTENEVRKEPILTLSLSLNISDISFFSHEMICTSNTNTMRNKDIFQLGARVVCISNNIHIPFGARATVIGHPLQNATETEPTERTYDFGQIYELLLDVEYNLAYVSRSVTTKRFTVVSHNNLWKITDGIEEEVAI
ncbi:hypothetical protein SNEBB_008286 [Seison nebaliae]|nr:hypothetical protein SNEBB_008286 [Seison nebaliae]